MGRYRREGTEADNKKGVGTRENLDNGKVTIRNVPVRVVTKSHLILGPFKMFYQKKYSSNKIIK